ncbi:Asp-tRNA(Asn)/Glu-tRNA(Gln) amidotransferase subunit GatC [Sulfurimonas sp.]
MQVDDALLSKLEKLSFLKVSSDKREEIIAELSEIVGFVDNLSELNTDNVNANFSMDERATPLREDIVQSNPQISDDILKHAPKSADHFFIVPKIIE